MELPLAGRALRQATRHMGSYLASRLRKGEREISEQTLAPEHCKRVDGAKTTEVNNYVISSVLETLPPGITPPPEAVRKMRWILE